MNCRQCEAHAVRIAELEEELAAWRGYVSDEASQAAALERGDRLAKPLGLPLGLALMTLCLADRCDHTVSRQQLLRAHRLQRNSLRPAEDVNDQVVDVHIWKIRRALSRRWARVETVRGLGYRMPADSARTVLALIGEGASA